MRAGLGERAATLAVRAGPLAAIAASTGASAYWGFEACGVAVVGAIPTGLPPLSAPALSLDLIQSLAGASFLISVVGFVESISVAQTLAAKRRQHVEPDQELIGLGAANVASSLSGGFSVSGGVGRRRHRPGHALLYAPLYHLP